MPQSQLLEHVTFPQPLPPFIQIIDLREDWNEELLHYFYENCMKKFFPIEDELDPIEVWIDNMHPDNRNLPSHKLLPDMHICLALDTRFVESPIEQSAKKLNQKPENQNFTATTIKNGDFDNKLEEEKSCKVAAVWPKIIAATVFEYYKLSNSALLSYFMVDEQYRQSGMGKYMTKRAFFEIETKIAPSYLLSDSNLVLHFENSAEFGELFDLETDENAKFYFEQAKICREKRLRQLSTNEQQKSQGNTIDSSCQNKQCGANFSIFFAETNAWGVHDGVMDAAQRHAIMRKIGYRMVDFDYIQPPLSEEQAPCTDLLLLVLDVDSLDETEDEELSESCGIGNGSTNSVNGSSSSSGSNVCCKRRKCIDCDLVKMFMLEFGYSVFENFDFISEGYFQHMLKDLDRRRGGRLCLSTDDEIPWLRRTRFEPPQQQQAQQKQEQGFLASKL